MSSIAHIRKCVLKVSQETLAEMTGVSQATVSRWEKGELWPNLRELTIIRDAGRAALPKGWKDAWLFDAPASTPASPAPHPETTGAAA